MASGLNFAKPPSFLQEQMMLNKVTENEGKKRVKSNEKTRVYTKTLFILYNYVEVVILLYRVKKICKKIPFVLRKGT